MLYWYTTVLAAVVSTSSNLSMWINLSFRRKKTSILILVFSRINAKLVYFKVFNYLASVDASAIESLTSVVTSSDVLVTTS